MGISLLLRTKEKSCIVIAAGAGCAFGFFLGRDAPDSAQNDHRYIAKTTSA